MLGHSQNGFYDFSRQGLEHDTDMYDSKRFWSRSAEDPEYTRKWCEDKSRIFAGMVTHGGFLGSRGIRTSPVGTVICFGL